MVSKPSAFGGKITGLFAHLFLWGAVGWVVWNLWTAFRDHSAMAHAAVESVRWQNQGHYHSGLEALLEARSHSGATRDGSALFWLRKIRPGAMDPDFAMAQAHRSLGFRYSELQHPLMAERHFTLALSHRPGFPRMAGDLLMECFYTRNLELGYLASRMAEKEGASVNPSLVAFFRREYDGPRYGEWARPGGAPPPD